MIGEDTMRLIDADGLFNWNGKKLSDAIKYGNKDVEQQNWSYSTLMMYEIADEIDDAPTVDAVPVGWTEFEEQKPPDTKYSEPYNVVVSNCSNRKTMTLDWTHTTIRGKDIHRWEWHGRISQWTVTHWMPLPNPPGAKMENVEEDREE